MSEEPMDEAGKPLLDPSRGPIERCESVIAHYSKRGDMRGDFDLGDVRWLIERVSQ